MQEYAQKTIKSKFKILRIVEFNLFWSTPRLNHQNQPKFDTEHPPPPTQIPFSNRPDHPSHLTLPWLQVLSLPSFCNLSEHVLQLVFARDLDIDEIAKFNAAIRWGKNFCSKHEGRQWLNVGLFWYQVLFTSMKLRYHYL